MGDRANIVVKAGDEQVCLYSHWGGSELPTILRRALHRGRPRWNDFQYLTRIIFMALGNEMGLTGLGITQRPWDGKGNIITVDIDAQTVALPSCDPVSFDRYVES